MVLHCFLFKKTAFLHLDCFSDMEFLEVLTEGLNRVLLVRGGGREVITIYSWSVLNVTSTDSVLFSLCFFSRNPPAASCHHLLNIFTWRIMHLSLISWWQQTSLWLVLTLTLRVVSRFFPFLEVNHLFPFVPAVL